MGIILYPVQAPHTEPIIQGLAQQAARCQVMCDLLADITLTAEEVRKYATIEFGLFSKRQEVETLTDDMEALEALYVSAYEQMYRSRYAEILNNLEKMAEQRNLECAD
jgi:hypothetical protein